MTAETPLLMPVKGICKHFGLSPATVNRWWKKELIKSVKVGKEGDGRSRLIYVASVHAYLETRQ